MRRIEPPRAPLAVALWFRALMAAACINAASPRAAATAEAPDVTADAMRLLKSNCFSCHNSEKKKGGLELTSREALLKGGDNGAAVEPGAPDKSGLVEALSAGADPHMPPKKQLSTAQIEVVRRWVEQGVKWDAAALAKQESARRKVVMQALPPAYHPVLAVALSPDATRLAVGCGSELIVYDVTGTEPTLAARASAHLDPVQSIAWSADGKHLLSGAFQRIVFWNAESLSQERAITEGLTDRIAVIRFTPDGKRIVVGDGRIGERGIVRVIDFETGRIAGSWDAHTDVIYDLAISRDGKLLATGSGDKLVKLWDFESHKELAKLEGHALQVLSVAFDPEGKRLISGGADQSLKVWDVQTREKINNLGTPTASINSLLWISAGPTIVAANEAGAVFRYTDLKEHSGAQTTETATEKKLENTDAALVCLAASQDGQRIFAGSQDGRLFAWNKDGKLMSKISLAEKSAPSADAPSFIRDVLPVLSKAGCNAGSCHAKPEGQNGFKLTVFSFDPQSDYKKLMQDSRCRRVFPSAPDESLILLKATDTIPHEGGERFAKDSDAYRTIAKWIQSGMLFKRENEPVLERITIEPAEHTYKKGESQQLGATAHFSDGSSRDVTALASFVANDKDFARVTEDGLVTAGKVSGQAVIVARFMGMVGDSRVAVPADRLLPDENYAALPIHNFIDELAYEQFKKLGLFPSETCSDGEFLRRASLDAIGVLPTVEEAREFLADRDSQKREKLIERLLAHPNFADYWANKWADLLRPNSDRVGVKSVYVLDQWLRECFRNNKPYNEFVREIVLAEGNTHRLGPAVIYRDRREPADLTTMFSQLFLGVRLDCAKCHHHPNEKWGQDDFYRMAAFFGTLRQKGAGISAPISAGNETFYFAGKQTVKHPVTGELLDPKAPDGPMVRTDEKSDPRRALADWLTGSANPFFARAIANRIWAVFFGRGIVDPVDDFRISNPPANPALLDALAQEVVHDGYDLKAFMRTIMRSHLYQLSAIPNEFNHADTRNFSRSYRRRMAAETLTDALADLTGVSDVYPGMPPASRAIQGWSYKIDSQTMDAFGRPNSSSDCPCERDLKPSIVQSLHLMNSRLLQEKLASSAGRIERLAKSNLDPEQIVKELYLACYTREPTAEELQIASSPFHAEGATRRSATEDVLWSLLNSAEFVFNH